MSAVSNAQRHITALLNVVDPIQDAIQTQLWRSSSKKVTLKISVNDLK
jgi:hypothetical protein